MDAKTVRKWRDRYLKEGERGPLRPATHGRRAVHGRRECGVPARLLELRRRHRWGAAHLAHETGLAASTVQRILLANGMGRLDKGDRATEPVVRYERERPGEAWSTSTSRSSLRSQTVAAGVSRGRGASNGLGAHPTSDYRYLHSAIDDRTRVVYSEVLDDERPGRRLDSWRRGDAYYAAMGINVERVLTDNGACYRSRAWRAALDETGIAMKRPVPTDPDQREDRALPSHPPRGVGLHQALDLRRRAPHALRELLSLLQSPPIPRQPRLEHSDGGTGSSPWGQRPRLAHLEVAF